MAIEDLQLRPARTSGTTRVLPLRTWRDGGDEHVVGDLVAAAAEGDTHAWHALVEGHAGLVCAITRGHRLGAADAADVAQTTWLRLFESLHRLQDPTRVRAWIATTARRECLRVLRGARHVEFRDELPEPSDRDHGRTEDEVLAAERDTLLWTAFARLGERDQALLRLLYVDPADSYEEISQAMEMPVGSIGPTRGRCLSKLRREVEALGVVGVG